MCIQIYIQVARKTGQNRQENVGSRLVACMYGIYWVTGGGQVFI